MQLITCSASGEGSAQQKSLSQITSSFVGFDIYAETATVQEAVQSR